jgi:hypothetical protein
VSEKEGERRRLSTREEGEKVPAMSSVEVGGETKSGDRWPVRAILRMIWRERTRTVMSCWVERYAGSMMGSSKGSALLSVIEP